MSRIKQNHSFIGITFMSVRQMEYQREKILEAIDAELDKFTGKEHIISGNGWFEDDEPIVDVSVETDPEKFFDEYQGDDPPRSENSYDYKDEKEQAIDVYITFIDTQKGRAQVERMKKAVDTILDEIKEKGLLASYRKGELGESDLTNDFSEEEIQAFQKAHNTLIRRYPNQRD